MLLPFFFFYILLLFYHYKPVSSRLVDIEVLGIELDPIPNQPRIEIDSIPKLLFGCR
jgi:hypothetical protein